MPIERKPLLYLVLFTLLFSGKAYTEVVVGKDGREINLNTDGTWSYASEDILLETPDGYTARLKPDNTWEYIGNATLQEESRHRELSVDIELLDVFINESVTSAGSASKNKRRSAQINFRIQVDLAPNSSESIHIDSLDKSDFTVSDNRGKMYEIADLSTSKAKINPGEQSILIINTKSAPSLLYAPKSLYLDIASNTLATAQKVRLERLYGTIERKRISD